MTLLRNNRDDLTGAIAEAARILDVRPLFVEKDYWVTQVLRALHQHHPGAFLFKGGTSLSKGYGLIERFSEDVDILVTPAQGDSARTREERLLSMTEDVAGALSVDWIPARKPGRGTMAHRGDVILYPKTVRDVIASMEDRGVLLETGFAGGEWPGEMVTIKPLLVNPLGIDPVEYEDTAEFQLKALHPARTLLEKASLLHHVATTFDPDAPTGERCGRHFYDVYRLLDDAMVRQALEDRERFRRLLLEMEGISSKYFGGWSPRPEGGYASSRAFTPERDTPLRAWLEERYAVAAELMPSGAAARWPSFGQVLRRVAEHRALL